MTSLGTAGRLQGETIVCLATQEWDAHWTPVQQVMLRLAPRNKVVYIEPFHGLFAWMKAKNQLLRRQRQERVPQLREVHPNLFVYRPEYPYLPGNMRLPAAHAFNSFVYKQEVSALLGRLNIRPERATLWPYFAQSLSVLDLPFERLVYDCVDDWVSFFTDPNEREFIRRIDEELCRRADVVFVGSEPLLQKKQPLNANTFVVNHGADIAHFAKAADRDTVVPPDLDTLPRPRIGFVGMVDPLRFDTDLIGAIAENDKYTVVIVGGFLGGAEQLIPRKPNIHCLGMKSVRELPSYLKGMDVCIMPYRVNETTRYIFPLKLFEYMGTGKPIVTTSIPAVQGFRNLMYVADSTKQYLACIETALRESNASVTAERQRCAWGYDWENHVIRKESVLLNRAAPGPAVTPVAC